jgi:hypothetical protein
VSRGTQDLRALVSASSTGLSPSLVLRSSSFQSLSLTLLRVLQPRRGVATPPVWAAPISLATTLGISVDFFSSGY